MIKSERKGATINDLHKLKAISLSHLVFGFYGGTLG